MKYNVLYIMFAFFSCNAIAQEGTSIEQYFNVEISDEQRAGYKDAIYSLSKEITDQPDNAILYLNRGVTYANLGLHVDAINDYNKAVKIDSTLSEAYYNRAVSKARFVYTKAACRDLKRAADLGLDEAKIDYNSKCGSYKKVLGEIETKE